MSDPAHALAALAAALLTVRPALALRRCPWGLPGAAIDARLPPGP